LEYKRRNRNIIIKTEWYKKLKQLEFFINCPNVKCKIKLYNSKKYKLKGEKINRKVKCSYCKYLFRLVVPKYKNKGGN
jgi:hypothetical protein